MKLRKKYVLYGLLLVAITIVINTMLAFDLYCSSKLVLTKTQAINRFLLFYPIKDVNKKICKKVKFLIKKEKYEKALKLAELYKNENKDDLSVQYIYNIVNSVNQIKKGLKFENVENTSSVLTFFAWIDLYNRDYSEAAKKALKCIELYEDEALYQEMLIQNNGNVEKNRRFYWALNDVASCYYILGVIYGKKNNYEKADFYFKKVITDFKHAYCYDPMKGFWSLAQASFKKVKSDIKYAKNDNTEDKIAVESVKRIRSKNTELKNNHCGRKKEFADNIQHIKVEEEVVEINDEVLEIKKNKNVKSFGMEELLFEEVDMPYEEKGTVKSETTKKISKIEGKKELVSGMKNLAYKEDEKNIEKKRIKLIKEKNSLKAEIEKERKAILKMLKRLGEPPIISIVVKENDDKKVLNALKEKRREIEKKLKERRFKNV